MVDCVVVLMGDVKQMEDCMSINIDDFSPDADLGEDKSRTQRSGSRYTSVRRVRFAVWFHGTR